MPVLSVCAVAGCSALLPRPGRCAAHNPRPWIRRPGNGRRRYGYDHDQESKRLRAVGTLCSYCNAEPMVALDHEIPLSQRGQDVASNRRPIGKRCHDVKTQRESRWGRRA